MIEGQHLGHPLVAGGTVVGLEVEAQQRLGVGRTEVEPPAAAVDRQAVEAVLR